MKFIVNQSQITYSTYCYCGKNQNTCTGNAPTSCTDRTCGEYKNSCYGKQD